MKKLIIAILFALSFNSLSAIETSDFVKNYVDNLTGVIKLYVILGQSNASGNGLVANISNPVLLDALNPPNHYIYSLCTDGSGGGVELLQVGVNNSNNCNNGKVGTELGISIANESVQTGFVKYAIGGTSLAEDPNQNDWNVNSTGEVYDDFLVFFDKAIQAYNDEGFTVVLERVIWIQGEADSQNQAFAEAYEENLFRLLEGVNVAIEEQGLTGVPNWTFVGLQSDSLQIRNPGSYLHANTVNEAMQNVSQSLGPRYTYYETVGEDLGYVDNVHYDEDALYRIGFGLGEMQRPKNCGCN